MYLKTIPSLHQYYFKPSIIHLVFRLIRNQIHILDFSISFLNFYKNGYFSQQNFCFRRKYWSANICSSNIYWFTWRRFYSTVIINVIVCVHTGNLFFSAHINVWAFIWEEKLLQIFCVSNHLWIQTNQILHWNWCLESRKSFNFKPMVTTNKDDNITSYVCTKYHHR